MHHSCHHPCADLWNKSNYLWIDHKWSKRGQNVQFAFFGCWLRWRWIVWAWSLASTSAHSRGVFSTSHTVCPISVQSKLKTKAKEWYKCLKWSWQSSLSEKKKHFIQHHCIQWKKMYAFREAMKARITANIIHLNLSIAFANTNTERLGDDREQFVHALHLDDNWHQLIAFFGTTHLLKQRRFDSIPSICTGELLSSWNIAPDLISMQSVRQTLSIQSAKHDCSLPNR